MEMKNKIAIVGSSGLIGSALKEHLRNYEIISVSGRDLFQPAELFCNKIQHTEIIINLAGYPINGRWTKKRKEMIYKSRIELTNNLVEVISLLNEKPVHMINASAVGIYRDGNLYDESANEFADNSLSKLVMAWESAANKVKEQNVNLTIIRLGIVLSRKGGAYKILRKIIKLGLGGKQGSGKQGYSFILINDLVRAIEFIIEKKIFGVVNLVCPQPIDNVTFVKELAAKLKRPLLFSIPAFILKAIYSEGSILFLNGQKVYPGILSKYNFNFIGNNLKSCIEILEK
jgi:uncharacterized protein (TIGR01777 family)